jgi:serine/threonine protein kinase
MRNRASAWKDVRPLRRVESTADPSVTIGAMASDRVVGGAYRIGELIGKGGMGEVYAAVGKDGRPVAIKLLRRAFSELPELAARFRREARIASRIASPFVASVLGAGKDRNGDLWIAFERLEGESLQERLVRLSALPFSSLSWIVDHVLQGLEAAHAVGIVHRDIKPGNIFIERLDGQSTTRGASSERARILDFGISKLREPVVETSHPGLTEQEDLLGSPTYMPPEQIGGPAGVDARGDLYSLGVVAVQALTGLFPFEGHAVGAMLHFKKTRDPLALHDLTRTRWPEPLESFLQTMLARDPARRFASASEALMVWRKLSGIPDVYDVRVAGAADVNDLHETPAPSTTLIEFGPVKRPR